MKQRLSSQIISIIAAASCASASIAAAAGADALVTGKASEGLVYTLASDDGMDLWRARLSDGALQQISATPDLEERWPRWSQAAGRLAYVGRNTDGVMMANIKLLDLATGETKGLGPDPDFLQLSPSWSPDGKSIAHVFRMPATQLVYITDAGAAIVNLEKATRLVIAKVEEIGHRMLSLEYSSDGRIIVAHGRAPDNLGDDKLWLLQSRALPHKLGNTPKGLYATPHFTRDNANVIFSHKLHKSQKRNLILLPLAPNAKSTRLASLPRADDHSAVASPVRDELVFVSDRDGSPDLFRVDLSGKNPVNLTKKSTDADISPVWSPDGERIAYIVKPTALYKADDKQHTSNRIRVIDRTGKLLFETAGTMPNWMPPWKGDQPVAAGVVAKAPAKAGTKAGTKAKADSKP